MIDDCYSSQNFEEAKSREVVSDAPREVDTTIHGWVRVTRNFHPSTFLIIRRVHGEALASESSLTNLKELGKYHPT